MNRQWKRIVGIAATVVAVFLLISQAFAFKPSIHEEIVALEVAAISK